MSDHIENALENWCQVFDAFSLASDKSTDIADNGQCAIFKGGVDKNLSMTKELLDLVPMKGTTTGVDIISVFEGITEHTGLQWEQMACAATPSVPPMVTSRSGLVGQLWMKLAEFGVTKQFVAVHCNLAPRTTMQQDTEHEINLSWTLCLAQWTSLAQECLTTVSSPLCYKR